jgi:hypothetical protein
MTDPDLDLLLLFWLASTCVCLSVCLSACLPQQLAEWTVIYSALLDRYEKMISGMYLGELSRLALVKLTQQGLAFDGKPTQELLTKDIFETAFMSPLEAL